MRTSQPIAARVSALVSCIVSFTLISSSLTCSVASAQTAIQDIPLDSSRQSVASLWVSEALFAVSDPAGQSLGPTGASRAYGMLGTAMYDAWSAYESLPASTTMGDTMQQPVASNTPTNKSEAISYAAYTVLSDLFPHAGLTQSFRNRMNSLGYDPDNTSSAAAHVGVSMANELLTKRHQDGSNQLNGYTSTSSYAPSNSPHAPLNDIMLWSPEFVPIGDPEGSVQSPLHPHWGGVRPFAFPTSSIEDLRPESPESFLLDPNASVDFEAKTITRANGTVVDIDASLIGVDINPNCIDQAIEVVKYSAALDGADGDRQKLIAEFWEDPSGTPYPPGSWMFFTQKITEADAPDLDRDVPLFFGVGNAVMDAGIATWEAKYIYDYARPVRTIRALGELGLIGEENEDGEYEIDAWGGPGEGTKRILARDFLTYQTPGQDPSPPFPEFTSGHSAFSAAAAQILREMTGSDAIVLTDGSTGLSVKFAPGSSRFEPGVTPVEETTLAWNTFSEAANEAGISRLYGGIHFTEGDIFGRDLGAEVGSEVFDEVSFYMNGAVPEPATNLMLFVGFLSLLMWRKR